MNKSTLKASTSVADITMNLNDKNKGPVMQHPKNNKLILGLQGFDTLVDQYLKHKKMMPMLNRLAQAKTRDFESPMLMSSAVLAAREYISLIQKLQFVIPVIANDYMNKILDNNSRLREMQMAANQLVDEALKSSKKARVKKGK